MPFYFTCPYCFNKTLVDEGLAGRSGPCVACGKTVTVPLPPARGPQTARPVGSPYVVGPTASEKRRLLAWGITLGGTLLGIGLLAAVSLFLLWPTLQGLSVQRDRAASMNNLQRIAQALSAYALDHGTFPPPVVYDASGQPLYSWRVLILDYLGEPSLAAAFDRDLAWDAPENLACLMRRPAVFASPAMLLQGNGTESSYALVTGANTLFPSAGPLRWEDVFDGHGQTLLVVETTSVAADWTRPWDIDVAKLNTTIGAPGPNAIGGVHPDGAAVAFADATPGWLPQDLSPALLRSLITPAGGEAVDATRYYQR